MFYATGKLMHQGALQITAAEANPWLRCYLDSFAAYTKYLITRCNALDTQRLT